MYKYIVIEGCIGAGKTTLSEMLAEDLNAELVLERFADNSFLPKLGNKAANKPHISEA